MFGSLGDALQFKVGLDLSTATRALTRFQRSAVSMFAGPVMQAVGFGALTAGAAAFAKGVVDAGSEAESFENRLSTLMGSSSAAAARLEELYDFAASTPYNTSQIVAAEVTLRGFGAAAEELLPGLIDFAAVTGQDLSQAAIDMGKAWNQGATGLESDAGKILRKQIELREGTDAATMGLEDFRQALLDTLDEGMFAGGAARLSRTFAGMVSNLEDEWDGFKREVAAAGIFDQVKGALSLTLDLIKQNRTETKAFASEVSGALWTGFKGVAYTVALIADGLTGAKFLATAAGAVLLDVTTRTQEVSLQLLRTWEAGLRMMGQDGAAGRAAVLNSTLAAGVATLRTYRDELAQQTGYLSQQPSYLQQTIQFMATAEGLAGTFADELERGSQAASSMDGGGDMEAEGGWKKLIEEQERLLQKGRDFTYEMATLDDTRIESIDRVMNERLAMNEALLAQEAVTAQEAADNELAIRRAAADEIIAIDQEIEDERAKAHEKALAQIEEEKQARLDSALTSLNVLSSTLASIGNLFESENAKVKAAHKAFAISSVLIDSLAAGIRAFVDLGPIGGAIAAAGIAADAAVAVNEIRKQHQGGVVYAHQGRYPDEYDSGNTRRLRQEATLNSQATRALGEQGVRAINGGKTAPTVIEFRVGRAVQREVIDAGLRSDGAISSAMASYRRSAGGVDAGFSGAVPV